MHQTTSNRPTVILPVTGPYTAKDQAKSDKANKFIGRGSGKSSTEKYRLAWGNLANSGIYARNDVIFISAEGHRIGGSNPDFIEIQIAINAGARFVTDNKLDRHRPYNTGERQVADFLTRNGYHEESNGFWTPIKKTACPVRLTDHKKCMPALS